MRWFYGVLALAVVGGGALALRPADVRPPAVRDLEHDPERVRRGRAIVERGEQAQGGTTAWQALSALSVEIRDVWDWTSFRLYMPLQDDDVRLAGRMRLHDYARSSTWTVLDGAGLGRSFGVEGGLPWRAIGEQRKAAGVGVAFYAPTMEYLMTLAFRVREGDVVSWIDEVVRDGTAYDRVLITWDRARAHLGTDQYVLYYRQDTGLLELMECTVRDFAPFITGSVVYHEWQTLDGGVALPRRYEMRLWDLDGPRVHEVTLLSLHALPQP